MADSKREVIGGVILFVVLIVVIMATPIGVRFLIQNDCDKVDSYFTITHKNTYTTFISTGKAAVPVKHHEVTIDMGGTPWDVPVSSSEYQELEVGDEVLCTVYYNSNKLVTEVILGRIH